MRCVLLLALVLLALLPSLNGPSGAVIDAASEKKKKKKPGTGKKSKPKEIVDLMLDIGVKMCLKLGKLVQRKNFDAARRCDLFAECIEDLTGMTDAMAGELDLTQQDLVDNALKLDKYMQLQMNLKTAAKTILSAKKPSEKDVSQQLSSSMSQWILNVATQQKGHAGAMDKIGREGVKNLQSMGIKLPSYGKLDMDEHEEEELLLDDDYDWAEAQSTGGDDYEAEEDEDLDDI